MYSNSAVLLEILIWFVVLGLNELLVDRIQLWSKTTFKSVYFNFSNDEKPQSVFQPHAVAFLSFPLPER